jgi:hypothetical protein
MFYLEGSNAMWKSAWGRLGTTKNRRETRPRAPRLFERLEPRLLLSVAFENVPPTDPVPSEGYAVHLEQQAQEEWVPYVPTDEQTVISMISDDAGTRATVTLTFPDAGYRVTDWGTVQEEGGRFSVNAQVERWTGPSEAVVTKLAHEYDFGLITGGSCEFAFYASQQYIESRWFMPGMEYWVPYVPTAEQTSIFISPSDTGMKATVTMTFGPGYGYYTVREWGTVHRIGNTFTVNAEVERLEGIAVVSEPATSSHEYDLGMLADGDYVFEFHVWDQLVESRDFRTGSEQFVPYVPTAEQTNILVMADGAGATKARVIILFSDMGYGVHDWGTLQQMGNTFSVNPEVERWTGGSLQSFITVAHDYDLGALPDGPYVFRFNAWQQPVESKEFMAPAALKPVFRFWSPVLLRHFYTLSTAERDKLINNYSDVWTYEQVAYYAFATDAEPDTVPVYRFWSRTLNAHFYTAREAERDKLMDNYSRTWASEGIAFYAYPHSAGYQLPIGINVVYRFWSQTLGSHFFTASEAERNKLLSLPTRVWEWELYAWYAYAPVMLDRQPA